MSFSKAALLAVLGLAPITHGLAVPTATQAASVHPILNAGARVTVAATAAGEPPAIASAATAFTAAVVNQHTAPISTVHANEAGAPTVVWGDTGAGIMARGATASFAVPTGWAGNVAVVEHGGTRSIIGDESLVEANFVIPDGYVVGVVDVDVSYVTGFSLPITCACDGAGVVTGCNKYLWDLGTCPNDNGVGSCKNPLRDDSGATSAVPFFLPCQGKAYTFVGDHAGNSFGVCQSGRVTCCVGASCPALP